MLEALVWKEKVRPVPAIPALVWGLTSALGWALERFSLRCTPGHLRSSPGTNMSARANKVVHV